LSNYHLLSIGNNLKQGRDPPVSFSFARLYARITAMHKKLRTHCNRRT